MSKTIDNIKSGNYEVVDNQGVSVTGHFTQCLEKEFADLEAKLAECEEKCKKAYQEGLLQKQFDKDMEIEQLKQQLAEKEKNALALFSALYDILEEQDPENVSSRIDYLTKQNNGAISDFYKEHKVLKQQLAEKDKEIEYQESMKILAVENKNKKAIEQLEKVKEKLLEELQNVDDLLDPQEYEDYHELIGCGRGYKNSIEEIDNQINVLRKRER